MLNGEMPIVEWQLLRQARALTRACLFDGVQVLGVYSTYILNLPLYLRLFLRPYLNHS